MRPIRSSLKSAVSLVALFVLCFQIPSLHATQKYRVTSSHPLNFITSGTKYITVQRLTSDSLTVGVYLWTNDTSHYSVVTTSLHWNNGDTSTRTISVTFRT